MSLLKRIKRIAELSKYDLDRLDLTEALVTQQALKPEGKPNGAFLEDMTETEEMEWERDHTLGWAKFKQRVEEILKPNHNDPTTLT